MEGRWGCYSRSKKGELVEIRCWEEVTYCPEGSIRNEEIVDVGSGFECRVRRNEISAERKLEFSETYMRKKEIHKYTF